jgi:hypothetical protein
MELPINCLGGDLFWWRESKDLHTLITIRGDVAGSNRLDPLEMGQVTLLFILHDLNGMPVRRWQRSLNQNEILFINSQTQEELQGCSEGVLAVLVLSDSQSLTELKTKYARLYSLVDWFSDNGDIVSLHNDQSFRRTTTQPIDFTEIVFIESEAARNFLVILNGPESQAPGAIQLVIQNHSGQTRDAMYQPELRPFSLHKLMLRELFPGLEDWSEGQHLTLTGRFDCERLFVRPYVFTEGRRLSGYHGGNLYQWRALPRHLYKYLGYGEVNPMVAVHDEHLTTTVNLLNTHGDLEDDFWVDARLYNQTGRLVAERERWLLAKRHQLTRGEIGELLENHGVPFTGHIALNFSEDNKTFFPRRLQALMEYRTEQSTARVMAWSDIWNGQEQLKKLSESMPAQFQEAFLGDNVLAPEGVIYRSYYRMWYKPPLISYLSITNCGVVPGYDKTVEYLLRLENGAGETLLHEGRVGPQATDYGPIDLFFPTITEFLAGQPVCSILVESESDLAIMHLTHHQVSGAYSAEHFMDAGSRLGGIYYASCGS